MDSNHGGGVGSEASSRDGNRDAAATSSTATPSHKRSTGLLSRLSFIRASVATAPPDERDVDGAAATGAAIPSSQPTAPHPGHSHTQYGGQQAQSQTTTTTSQKTRRRKGSLRKVALLGRNLQRERRDSKSGLTIDTSLTAAFGIDGSSSAGGAGGGGGGSGKSRSAGGGTHKRTSSSAGGGVGHSRTVSPGSVRQDGHRGLGLGISDDTPRPSMDGYAARSAGSAAGGRAGSSSEGLGESVTSPVGYASTTDDEDVLHLGRRWGSGSSGGEGPETTGGGGGGSGGVAAAAAAGGGGTGQGTSGKGLEGSTSGTALGGTQLSLPLSTDSDSAYNFPLTRGGTVRARSGLLGAASSAASGAVGPGGPGLGPPPSSAAPRAKSPLSGLAMGPVGAVGVADHHQHDYAETEWWGWVVLGTTWFVFVIGMGTCLGVWSWAWDVGITPYAPPELEDDPTLPIVGYYPTLMILTGVMAWVWVVVAWVGMKYFRHAKFSGD